MNILQLAKLEEQARKKASYEELKKLEQVVQNANITNVNKENILEIVTQDIVTITNLNQQLANFTLHPALKYNKLLDIFNCGYQIIENHYDFIINGSLTIIYPLNPDTRTILYGAKDSHDTTIDYFGTGLPNCMQNAYFYVLRSINNITTIKDLVLNYGIYNVDISPNIQTTIFPNDFNSTTYESWFYYYQDSKSPQQGELLTPAIHYVFGGSRADERYSDKLFKAQDCSSWITELLKTQYPFSTYHLKMLYFNESTCNEDEWCVSVKDKLTPAHDITVFNASAGMIYCYVKGGHTGFVTNNYLELETIETLSFNRDIPKLEGLGYRNHSFSFEKGFIFFEEKQQPNLDLTGEQQHDSDNIHAEL